MTTRVHGTDRRFWAQRRTSAPAEVWRLWTTPATWGGWDRGLRTAHLDDAFVVGAEGWLTDLAGRRSRFVVTEVLPGLRCGYEVRLPAARLVLLRTVRPSATAEPAAQAGAGAGATVIHEVAFTGALARVWARVLGPGFRRQLGPAVDALVDLAERTRPGGRHASADPTDA